MDLNGRRMASRGEEIWQIRERKTRTALKRMKDSEAQREGRGGIEVPKLIAVVH